MDFGSERAFGYAAYHGGTRVPSALDASAACIASGLAVCAAIADIEWYKRIGREDKKYLGSGGEKELRKEPVTDCKTLCEQLGARKLMTSIEKTSSVEMTNA
jgi:hypothetical protein